MNVACDYEAPMQMLTTEKYIAAGVCLVDLAAVTSRENPLYDTSIWNPLFDHRLLCLQACAFVYNAITRMRFAYARYDFACVRTIWRKT